MSFLYLYLYIYICFGSQFFSLACYLGNYLSLLTDVTNYLIFMFFFIKIHQWNLYVTIKLHFCICNNIFLFQANQKRV